AGANHTVSFGVSHNVQGIQGPVSVVDPGGSAMLVVDDSTDSVARHVTLDSITPPGDTLFGRIRGLAPAAITYRYADAGSLFLFTGTVASNIDALGTGVPTILSGAGGTSTVNVGSANSVQGILGRLNIGELGGSFQVNVNDSADTVRRSVTL